MLEFEQLHTNPSPNPSTFDTATSSSDKYVRAKITLVPLISG